MTNSLGSKSQLTATLCYHYRCADRRKSTFRIYKLRRRSIRSINNENKYENYIKRECTALRSWPKEKSGKNIPRRTATPALILIDHSRWPTTFISRHSPWESGGCQFPESDAIWLDIFGVWQNLYWIVSNFRRLQIDRYVRREFTVRLMNSDWLAWAVYC